MQSDVSTRGAPLPAADQRSTDPEDVRRWEFVEPRRIETEDWRRFERHVAEILTAFGLNLDTAGTAATPQRFLRALHDATAGYEGDPQLLTAFPTECRGGPDCRISQIVEGRISFYALCEHHALPFHGVAHVGYVAHESIIGISKLTRLVRLFARRFTVQERLGQQIADTLVDLLQTARRRRTARGRAPVHADARRTGGAVEDGDHVLARHVRRGAGDAPGVPGRGA